MLSLFLISLNIFLIAAIFGFSGVAQTTPRKWILFINEVTPSSVWTSLLISASFSVSAKEVKEFGSQVPISRPGEPKEIASSYVFWRVKTLPICRDRCYTQMAV